MLPPCIFTLVLLTHNDLCLSGPPAVVALILAIKTWKVKIKTLNDSKYVAALVYISSVIVAVLALLSFAFGVYLNLTAVVYNGGILLITTIFLLLLFVPKMYWLYKDPNGENVLTQNYPLKINTESSKTGASIIQQLKSEVKHLQSKLKELECETPETLVSNDNGDIEVSCPTLTDDSEHQQA
eukprot:Em0023g257a